MIRNGALFMKSFCKPRETKWNPCRIEEVQQFVKQSSSCRISSTQERSVLATCPRSFCCFAGSSLLQSNRAPNGQCTCILRSILAMNHRDTSILKLRCEKILQERYGNRSKRFVADTYIMTRLESFDCGCKGCSCHLNPLVKEVDLGHGAQ